MHRIKRLIDRCKCSATISINKHRDYYHTAEKDLENRKAFDDEFELDQAIRDKMVELNTIVDIHFYTDTPVGFYEVLHYDLDKALDEAMEILDENP